jgi:ferredoxin-NADP reductase
MRNPLGWQIATVTEIRAETASVKSFTLRLPNWTPHKPGQHYDLRLTAPDGYQAQRSYSIASEPERTDEVDLTVERIPDGEVSTYLHDVLVQGDQVEVRGPIGGYFVWDSDGSAPLLLIGGGSGVVPLMSMLRHRRAVASGTPAVLLYSSRSFESIIYRKELEQLAKGDGLTVHHTLTRSSPPAWKGFTRRIDEAMLREVAEPLGPGADVFICGPTLLVESAAELLVKLGFAPGRIRTERFGPTGG